MEPGAMAVLGIHEELGGNNSSGTAVLGMAVCKIQGAVKGRDRHRVTSDAALSWGGLSVRVNTPKIQLTSLHW